MLWTDVIRVTQPTAMQSASIVLNFVTSATIRSSFDMTGNVLVASVSVSSVPSDQSNKQKILLWCRYFILTFVCSPQHVNLLLFLVSLYHSYLETHLWTSGRHLDEQGVRSGRCGRVNASTLSGRRVRSVQ